jgi:4-aminobutyrate aminotransferase
MHERTTKGLPMDNFKMRHYPVSKERATKETEQIMYECLRQGVASKIIEGNVFTMRPSLVIDKNDCAKIIYALTIALEKAASR